MADVFDRKMRSRIMRAVRVARTEPEDRLAVILKTLGLRFRRNDQRVFGSPDFVFRHVQLAIFVDGDFWHGRTWFDEGAAPETNAEFWIGKFERNRRRDLIVARELRRDGWSVIRLWASDLRKEPFKALARVRTRIRRLERETSR